MWNSIATKECMSSQRASNDEQLGSERSSGGTKYLTDPLRITSTTGRRQEARHAKNRSACVAYSGAAQPLGANPAWQQTPHARQGPDVHLARSQSCQRDGDAGRGRTQLRQGSAMNPRPLIGRMRPCGARPAPKRTHGAKASHEWVTDGGQNRIRKQRTDALILWSCRVSALTCKLHCVENQKCLASAEG
jgi:hypothetical protein